MSNTIRFRKVNGKQNKKKSKNESQLSERRKLAGLLGDVM